MPCGLYRSSYYEGALALGATMKEVFWHCFPGSKIRVFAGIVLGIGRAIGETMAVIMVAGNQPRCQICFSKEFVQ